MTVQFYFDENVSGHIVRGLRRREVDILTTAEDGLAGFADECLLQRATDLDRVMFSQDSDLVAIAKRWQAEGRRFSGLIYVAPERIDVGRAVRELELIAKAMEAAELAGVIKYLPL